MKLFQENGNWGLRLIIVILVFSAFLGCATADRINSLAKDNRYEDAEKVCEAYKGDEQKECYRILAEKIREQIFKNRKTILLLSAKASQYCNPFGEGGNKDLCQKYSAMAKALTKTTDGLSDKLKVYEKRAGEK